MYLYHIVYLGFTMYCINCINCITIRLIYVCTCVRVFFVVLQIHSVSFAYSILPIFHCYLCFQLHCGRLKFKLKLRIALCLCFVKREKQMFPYIWNNDFSTFAIYFLNKLISVSFNSDMWFQLLVVYSISMIIFKWLAWMLSVRDTLNFFYKKIFSCSKIKRLKDWMFLSNS